MSPRVFVFLLLVTVAAIWIGDTVAAEYAAPGLERTFSVLVIAALIVAPVAWILERLGFIRRENFELGRRGKARKGADGERNGGAA
jgi:hypothetical protein